MYNTQPCARSTFFGANPPTPHMAGSSSPSSTPPHSALYMIAHTPSNPPTTFCRR